MDLTLKRNDYTPEGIFSTLTDESGAVIAITLDHAYDSGHGDGSYQPKLRPGTYSCIRGTHRLHNMTHDFETFEITGVKGHTNILFHAGNFNKDSDGCVLLGNERHGDMIMNSKVTFSYFMSLQEGVDQFTLTVIA
jgi:hypothetical protein